ncbi:hypothetical protein Goari_023726, partial [Gossypium aridum]|nr:hypothetical protein [Gossypium aridum]
VEVSIQNEDRVQCIGPTHGFLHGILSPVQLPQSSRVQPRLPTLGQARTDNHPPQITVAFVNGVEEVFHATSTPAQTIRTVILRKGQMLETEHMFREAGEKWPIIIPEELHQSFPRSKVWAFFSSGLVFNCCSLCSVGRGILSNNWYVFV